jgi:hypothetical protein
MLRRLRAIAAPLLAAVLLSGCPAEKVDECPSGQKACNGSCVDTQTDPSGCGPYCEVCPFGGSCVSGACECPPGTVACSGSCVDPLSDGFHCGACGVPCGLGTCVSGGCVCDPPPVTACTGPGWQCADLQGDPSNCGTCRLACAAYESCVTGTCTCVAPHLDCSGTCVPADEDEANCGACGKVCATGATCTSSACHCPGATVVCGTAPGACVDTETDEGHCGDCATVCPTGATCTAGDCACPGSPSAICGTGAGTCCEGTGCCGGSCQTEHANGLGQSYYDCLAVGTRTLASALAAADAWSAGTDVDLSGTLCPSNCYGRRNAAGTQYAIWCYTGSAFAGHVRVATGPGWCPTDANPSWD